MEFSMTPTWRPYVIPAILLIAGLFFLLDTASGAKTIGLFLFLLEIIYLLYVFNMRLIVDKDKIVYGRFFKRTILLSEITEAKRGSVSFRGAAAPTLIIKSKKEKIQIPVKSFEKGDLDKLYAILKI